MLFLPEVIGHVHIAQKWQLAALFFAIGLDLGDFVGQDILVAHHHHRHSAPAVGLKPFTDLLGIISRCVHHIVTGDIAFFRVNDPCVIRLLGDACGGREAQDFRTHVTGAFGQRLCQLGGVNVTVVRIVQCARKIMGFDKRVAGFDFVQIKDFQIHALLLAHAFGAFEFLHPFLAMGQTD